ncbi:MAG: class I SAM-dependent methyltransferase [Syntrophus sp. (in: bacteria)]
MKCRICKEKTKDFWHATILGKYDAIYKLCLSCGFIYVENPFWLAESYESAITSTDIGIVSRIEVNSQQTKSIIELFFDHTAKFLDYGAGYGMLVRRMRDIGYDFLAYDRYCENLFSSQFKVESLEGSSFQLITAFEVIEHLENPIDIFAEIFNHSESILFTTELVPAPPPLPGKWWYYGLDHGQHISFFTSTSLKYIANLFGKRFYSNEINLHLMTSQQINEYYYRLSSNRSFYQWLHFLRQRPSLLQSDWQNLRENTRREISE